MPSDWPGPNYFSAEQFKRAFPDNAVRTETPSGRIRTRRKSMKSSEVWEVAWHMTTAQLNAFETFYRTTLVEGTLPFQGLTHPHKGAEAVWIFAADPEITPWHGSGVEYLVTAKLMYLPDTPTP